MGRRDDGRSISDRLHRPWYDGRGHVAGTRQGRYGAPSLEPGLRRDSSVHACQRGELSVRGLARARLKRVAIRAKVNGGFNRRVTLRNLDLSGPDHTDWYAFNSP